MDKDSGVLAFLRVAVKVTFWAEVVVAGLMLILITRASFIVGAEPIVMQSQNVTMRLFGHQIAYPEGAVAIANPRRLLAAAAGFTIPVIAVSLFVLFQLRSVFDSMATGTPFTVANANRISGMGMAILAGAAVRAVSETLAGRILADSLEIQGSTTVKSGIMPPIGWVLGGLLVLTLAEIFRYGVKLQEEHDTTI